ncbi:MAG: sulfotransferase [Alphaproteobacteria bacterium]|nr:sulfotransferase [Alphaproteobacteria bacterium]MBL7099668.1 sulfotransferase [Alphaproteobacteria bacterium]
MSQPAAPQSGPVLTAVSAALQRGDHATAMRLSEDAVRNGTNDPGLLVLAGQGRLQMGKPRDALAVLSRAHELAPDNPEVLNTLGVCLSQLGLHRDAASLLEKAAGIAPEMPHIHLHLATALEDLGELRRAQAALEEAARRRPNYTLALSRLAGLHARRGEFDKARKYAEHTLRFENVPGATIALAMAEFADGKLEATRWRIRPLADDARAGPVNQFIALGIMGDVLDAEGRTADAFAAYSKAREILRAHVAPHFTAEESAIDRIRRLTAYFRVAPVEPWRAQAGTAGSNKPVHVFLVGFPRSGTTLLEQALASHGDIRTMEEVDCLGDAVGEYFYAQDGMERFAALGEADLAKLREDYWARVAAAGVQADRRIFIDKMPLNSVHQGLIARLFPGAKILFALRDPRDVILSCFRRRLVMSAHMFELSTFEGATAFYDAVMTLAQFYRDRLGFPTLDIRHEDMVADFDGQMRRVCDFLGVPFDGAMRDFAAHARDRDIKTPSAHQIARGLNSEGAGQWKKYRDQFAPVLPVLNPWAERFGYEV